MLRTGRDGIRVFVYSETNPVSPGGAEAYVSDLCKVMMTRGPHILIGYWRKGIGGFATRREIIESTGWHAPRVRIGPFSTASVLRRFKPNIVHLSSPSMLEFILIPLCKIMNIPVLVTLHGFNVGKVGRLVNLASFHTIYRLTNLVLVQSERDLHGLLLPSHIISKIRLFRFNGVDTAVFQPAKIPPSLSQPMAIFIGNIDTRTRHKGFDLLFSAIKLATKRRKLSDCTFIAVGVGNRVKEFERLAAQNGIKNLKFYGRRSQTELVGLIQSASVLILPSSSDGEGFGRVALEAIACRVPVIVSKFAGVAEMIERYGAGLVIDPYHPTELIDAIESVLYHRGVAERITQMEEKLLKEERIGLSDTVSMTLSIYEALVNSTNIDSIFRVHEANFR